MLAAIGLGTQLLGGLLGARSAKRSANRAAEQNRQQANQVFESSKFRPVGMTSRFGSSNIVTDANGNVINAGYELNPELRGMQDFTMGQAGGYGIDYANQTNQQAQGLFGLGSQYLGQSPQEVSQNWMTNQQSLLAPARERALAGVRNNLFNAGRGGLSVGATGVRPDGSSGLNASNPEMEAYYNALAQQDLSLAGQANEQGMNQVRFGAGLLGTGQQIQSGALNPFSSYLRASTDLESLGRQPYEQSLDLAERQARINGAARNNWATIMGGATRNQQQAGAINPFATALGSVGSALGGMSFGANPRPYVPYNSETTIPMQPGGGY